MSRTKLELRFEKGEPYIFIDCDTVEVLKDGLKSDVYEYFIEEALDKGVEFIEQQIGYMIKIKGADI